jgi:two-component system, LytTR family, sensor kinase
MAGLWILLASAGGALAGAVLFWKRGSRRMGTPAQRAIYETLHTASLAVSALREGLTSSSAVEAAPALRRLLGTPAIALADRNSLLAYEGSDRHAEALAQCLRHVVGSGRSQLLSASDLRCAHGDDCPVQAGVAVPIAVGESVVGALAALAASAQGDLLRAAGEVARGMSAHLALAELDASRARTMQAQLNFLRAQISPHFIYNALTAIESYVRSDPERARDLLVGFAEFTRSTFREHSQYATLAQELRLVDTYLELERARFGDRLTVILRVAPEVLPVRVPSLVLQPLVENAIRHGIERVAGSARLQIIAVDTGHEALVTVEDDGAGVDPRQLEDVLAGRVGGESVGLRNVDKRLRATFGTDHGLTIETGIGAGTKVTMRVPKHSAALCAQ